MADPKKKNKSPQKIDPVKNAVDNWRKLPVVEQEKTTNDIIAKGSPLNWTDEESAIISEYLKERPRLKAAQTQQTSQRQAWPSKVVPNVAAQISPPDSSPNNVAAQISPPNNSPNDAASQISLEQAKSAQQSLLNANIARAQALDPASGSSYRASSSVTNSATNRTKEAELYDQFANAYNQYQLELQKQRELAAYGNPNSDYAKAVTSDRYNFQSPYTNGNYVPGGSYTSGNSLASVSSQYREPLPYEKPLPVTSTTTSANTVSGSVGASRAQEIDFTQNANLDTSIARAQVLDPKSGQRIGASSSVSNSGTNPTPEARDFDRFANAYNQYQLELQKQRELAAYGNPNSDMGRAIATDRANFITPYARRYVPGGTYTMSNGSFGSAPARQPLPYERPLPVNSTTTSSNTVSGSIDAAQGGGFISAPMRHIAKYEKPLDIHTTTTAQSIKIEIMSLECNKSKNEILTAATTAVLREGMTIQQSDANIGLLHAESMSQIITMGVPTTIRYIWQIQVTNSGEIIATAQGVLGSGSGSYFNDETSQDHKWYWGIRNVLAALCGNSVVFTTR